MKTLSCLKLPFQSSTTKKAVNCGIDSRLAVDEDDLKWVKTLLSLLQIVKNCFMKTVVLKHCGVET